MAQRRNWLWLVIALFVSVSTSAQTASELDGDWDGALATGVGVNLRLALHVESHGGTATAFIISLDQGNTKIPVATIARDGDAIELDVPMVHGGFKGQLSGDSLTGTWTQGQSFSRPLIFTRRAIGVAAPQAMKRPQEPEPPFPYKSEDVTFAGPGGITLAGTLTVPEGPGPFPAAVLVQGSGRNDRDETIAGHKPFLVLADALTKRGVAVLRIDKRGVGKSTGEFASATSENFANDTEATVAYLRTLKSVDAKKVGLIGHSEGGLIAPMVAAKDPMVAFVVLMAGPGLKGEDVMHMQQRLILQAMGTASDKLDKAAALNQQVLDIMRTEPDLDQARTKLRAALAADGIPTAEIELMLGQLATPWFQFFLNYDPVPTLREIRCPVLAVGGSLDVQVPPKEDLAAIKAALASNHDATVKELPGLNHLFQTAKTGALGEYNEIEETIAPSALAIITDWVVQRTK